MNLKVKSEVFRATHTARDRMQCRFLRYGGQIHSHCVTLCGPPAARKRTKKLLTGCPGNTGSDSSNDCLHMPGRSTAGKKNVQRVPA